MLEHDELLPVEKQHPALVQQLRNVYQLTPEEQRVLARVHERLASTSYPLPAHEPIQLSRYIRHNELVDDGRIFPPTITTRKRWSRRLNAIAGLIFLTLLLGSLVLTFSIERHTLVGSVGLHNSGGGNWSISLVPAESSGKLSQQEVQVEATILSQRFNNFGLQGFSTHLQMIHGQLRILLNLPHFDGNEQQTVNTLLQVGMLDFWNTGPVQNENAILAQGVTFHPDQYIQYNPGEHPLFTNVDLEASAFSMSIDPQTGHPQIEGEMKGDAISHFATFTANHINHGLTITLDGKVLSSANIQSAITGPFVILGNYTEPQIQTLISVLKYGPLPYALKILK